MLGKTSDIIDEVVMREVLRALSIALSTGNAHEKHVSASILSDCLASESHFVFDSLKELGVIILLFQALSDCDLSNTKDSNHSFLQDALHIISTLVSGFRSLALHLSYRRGRGNSRRM